MPDDVFVLAFDHRQSLLSSFFGVEAEPTPTEAADARLLKRITWGGLRTAISGGLPVERAGALVDPTYGRDVIEEARDLGVRFAIPVEESGRDEFAFEVRDWRERLDALDPAWAKVLVRYHPGRDAAMNARQRDALREVSARCSETGRGFMVELLIPPTPDDLAAVAGDRSRYDREIRPAHVVDAMRELQAAGVEPAVWKLEGLERTEDCAAVAEVARLGGRTDVGCVVLGRGADLEAVERWLRVAATAEGFVGFAVGRTIWWDPMRSFFGTGASEEAADAASSEIARRYRGLVDVFTTARGR